MGVNRLKGFINGYILVRVECLNPEKFINMTYRNGIIIRDVERLSYTTLEFKIRHNQYRLLKGIVRKNSAKIRIIRKYGMNFLIKKSKNRKFFVLGIAVFVFIIFSLSSIIWNIQIEGNKNISKPKLYKALYNAGLKKGKVKYGINLREVESLVVKQIDELSVINIRIYGTLAKVKVVERTMPPKIVPMDKPANIIASKEGVILKVIAYKGQSMVTQGDYVIKNQLLISGVLRDTENLPLKTVHSMGKIYAKTWYEEVQSIPINYKYEEKTGNYIKKVNFIASGNILGSKNHGIKFKKYDKIEEISNVNIASYKLPIQKLTTYYYEKVERNKKLSYDEAYNIGIKSLENKMKNIIPKGVKLVNKKITKKVEKDCMIVKLLYILEENIGVEQEIK